MARGARALICRLMAALLIAFVVGPRDEQPGMIGRRVHRMQFLAPGQHAPLAQSWWYVEQNDERFEIGCQVGEFGLLEPYSGGGSTYVGFVEDEEADIALDTALGGLQEAEKPEPESDPEPAPVPA